MSRKQAFPTNGAYACANRPHGVQAFLADGKSRNSNQRLATNAAVGGKKNREKAPGKIRGNSPRPGWNGVQSNRGPSGCGFGLHSPNSVSTTAEDGLRDRRKNRRLARRLLVSQYNGA
ncbi:MAG: hypothetical protein WBV69_00030 [Candidatus Sulfotelmatobacter sp.]